MTAKTLFSRLFIFFVGLPIVLTIVFLNYHTHLPLHLLIILFCFWGSREAFAMFSKKTSLLPKSFIVFSSILIPISAALYKVLPSFINITFPFGTEIITYVFIFTVLVALFIEVVTAQTFETSILRVTSSVFIILYSGYMLTFVSRMTDFSKNGKDASTPLIAVFLMMVFFCDSFAWFFGVLFGKNNKGFIKSSPNKSLAGFSGGFVGSIFAGLLALYIWPDIFVGSPVKIIVIGILMAFSSIVGDLIESVFKRSADVKDSGKVIYGRGGALDSVDSIIMSVPIFYILISIFYGPFGAL